MRTFIAIDIPEKLRTRLASVRAELAALLADQKMASVPRWNSHENYHLTLRFLGETTAEQRDAVGAMLADVAQGCAPFSLGLAGLGAFANWRQMRVLWVGVTGDLSTLLSVQAQIEGGVRACGFAADRLGYHPHATLAYVNKGVNRRLVQEAGTFLSAQTKLAQDLGQWKVSELVLMRSDPRPSGAEYTVLGRYRLGSG